MSKHNPEKTYTRAELIELNAKYLKYYFEILSSAKAVTTLTFEEWLIKNLF